MNLHALKSILISAIALLASVSLQAQYDDVYFDPDNFRHKKVTLHEELPPSNAGDDYGVTYYDNDHYQYYDDDYGYDSGTNWNIGFGISFPFFSFYSYPSWGYPYYYSGSSIYVNFGYGGYYPYNNWYGCNSWGYYNPYYYGYGYPYYYGYGGGCGNYYNNWGGCNSYYPPYGNGSCGGGYYPDHYPDYYPGYYYGPRTSGNTGSSPRGPIQPPGVTQPVLEGRALAEHLDRPAFPVVVGEPGLHDTPDPNGGQVEAVPSSIPATRGEAANQVNKEIPVDKELKRTDPAPGPKRPVFKPEPSRFEPYPNTKSTEVASVDSKPEIDRPVYRPYTPPSNPTTRPEQPGVVAENDKPVYNPNRGDQKPSFKPTDNGTNDRPTYTPRTRSDDRPDYRPAPSNNDQGKSNDRPTYSPPPRSAPSSSGDSPSGRSRSEASKPDNTSRSESPSHGYSPSRSGSSGSGHSSGANHSSGGSSSGRSSGGSSSGHSSGGSSSGSSSPRGRG